MYKQPAKKDSALVAIKKAATKLAYQVEGSLGIICPVTGLFTPTSLPPINGLVMEAYNPICFNALALLALPSYATNLEPEYKAALILATLHKLDKLILKASSVAVNLALCTRITNKQLDIFVTFIQEQMLATNRHYPRLALDGTATDQILLAYMATCVMVENTVYDSQLSTVAKVPAFLSSSTQGKALNTNCYEAWLELAPFVPASTKEKAKPFIKQLATYADSALINRLVSAAITYVNPNEELVFEGQLELSEFCLAVEASRKKAEALGLHKGLLDDEEPLLPSAPVEAAPIVEAAPTTPATLSFSERMKAKKALAN